MPKLNKKLSALKQRSNLSKTQLALFAAVFALIGGYVLIRSFAASPLVTSLEAEQMLLPSGGSIITDSTASGGKAIELSANGTATGSVSFPSSVTSLTVLAKGDQCSGAPAMTVMVDSTTVLANTSVSATSWTSYSYTPASAWTAGTHTLSIAFNNDYSYAGKVHGHSGKNTGGCDRNLYVDVTNFYGPTVITPPPTVTLSASPTSVASGSASTLTWASTNASSCTASGAWSGTEPTSGSTSTGALNATSTYSLACTGSGGSASASATVTVTAGFTTSLTNGMTITPPYTWTFNPGVTTVKGYFWDDNTLLGTALPDASGIYTFVIQPGALSSGVHNLGHGWDLPDGTHQTPPSTYSVTISNPTNGGGSGNCAYTNTAWCNATNFPTPAFTPTRVVDVYSQSAFMTAWSNIQAGDQINVHGVTFTGTVNLTNENPSNWAQVSFDSTTSFVGPSSAVNEPSVYIVGDSHIRFYGGVLTNSASNAQADEGILIHGNVNYVSWWNFVIHYVGGGPIGLFPAEGPSSNIDLKGEVYDWGHNLTWDPHAEKGSGVHGINISDAAYPLTNSRFAIYAHDGTAGAGMEVGSDSSTTGNTIYMWCQNLTFVSLIQTGGNCVQVWGINTFNNTFAYIEAENIQGRPYDTNGVSSGQSLSSDVVQYGRATNTNLNTKLESGTLPGVRWDTRYSTTFQNVSPLP